MKKKFSRTQKFTKTNIYKLPEDRAIVYKIKNSSGKNLYTGIAKRGRSQERLLEHKDLKKDQIPGGTKFQYTQTKDVKLARILEKKIIESEQPEHNEQGK